MPLHQSKQEKAIEIICAHHFENEQKFIFKVCEDEAYADAVIYLESVGFFPEDCANQLLNEFWKKVVFFLKKFNCVYSEVQVIFSLTPKPNLTDEQIEASIILNLHGALKSFLALNEPLLSVVIKCRSSFNFNNSFYEALFESRLEHNHVNFLIKNVRDLLADSENAHLLPNIVADSDALELLKANPWCNTFENLQGYWLAKKYQPNPKITPAQALSINFLWAVAECASDEARVITLFQKWLMAIYKAETMGKYAFNTLSNLIMEGISPQSLYKLIQDDEDLIFFKNNNYNLVKKVRAYEVLYDEKIEDEIITKEQAISINELKAIYVFPLTSESFHACLKEVLWGDSQQLQSNIHELLQNNAQAGDIAAMLQPDTGFELLRTVEVVTPEVLLANQLLLSKDMVLMPLSRESAGLILAWETLSQEEDPILGLDYLIEKLIASRVIYDKVALNTKETGLAYNLLSLTKIQQNLSETTALKLTLQCPAWLDYLKSSIFGSEERKALSFLLLSGIAPPSSILSLQQIRLINNEQISCLNSREIYQKIYENPGFIANVLESEPHQIEMIFKMVHFGHSGKLIMFCRSYQSPNLYNMLRNANTKEMVDYAASFCEALDQLEGKLPNFNSRGQNAAGQAAMKLFLRLGELLAIHFRGSNWNSNTVEEFKAAVTKELSEKEYAVLEQHRGVLGATNSVAGFIWGKGQNTLFQTNTGQLLQILNGGQPILRNETDNKIINIQELQ